MLGEGRVGAWALSDGATHEVRLGNTGELIIGDAHARFYEAVKRGNVYTFGVSNTAIAAVNAVATTGATAKPMIGLWNPSTSLVNLVVLKAIAIETTIPASAVSPAGLMWTYSVGNSAISTGGTPINAKTLLAAGSAAKAFAMATALTGMSGALAVLRAAAIVTPEHRRCGHFAVLHRDWDGVG